METRVYRYRRAATAPLPFFLTFWTVGLILALLRQALGIPPRSHNPPGATAVLCGVGVGIGILAFRLILGWLFERVEIEDGEILWIDWRNREVVRTGMDGIRAVRKRSGSPFIREGFEWWRPQGRHFAPPVECMTILTQGGDIPVSGTISDYTNLQARVQAAWKENVTRKA